MRLAAAFTVLVAAYHLPRLAKQDALMLAVFPAAWLAARALGMRFATAYALEPRRAAWAALAGGLVLACLAKLLAVQAGVALGIYTATAPAAVPAPRVLATLALFTFVPSLAEDILTRGFWARLPRWRWTAATFVSWTTLAYVLNHWHRLSLGPFEVLMLACFGLAYGAAFWGTGTLWAAVGLHWGWNFAGEALQSVRPVQAADADAARLVSAATHLVLFAVVLAAIRYHGRHGPREPDPRNR